MLIKRHPNGIDLPFPSEITPREIFESRRTFIRQLAVGSIAGSALLEMALI
jgi:methionine sulfoxide reductase catalytic subunit